MGSLCGRTLCAILGLITLTACAGTAGTVMVDGQALPRITKEWVGSPYAIRLSGGHPRPGEPTGGATASGGMLTGVVCGVSLDYEVEHKGDHIQIVGQLDNAPNLSSSLRMAGDADVRLLKGALASRMVDLKLTRDAIVGFVGRRPIHFERSGDEMRYTFQVASAASVQVTNIMKGVDELWRLPATVQMVAVPMLIACMLASFEDTSRPAQDPPAVVFGGKGGAVPPGTLVFR